MFLFTFGATWRCVPTRREKGAVDPVDDFDAATGPGDPLPSRAQARVGDVLCGKYRLDRVLGIGGMASVYGAIHLRNANRVAVKILHPELALNAGVRARFMREGYAANSVEHPRTVRILDDDIAEDGSVFLVMDLLDGETLDARWERSGRKLPVGEVVAAMSELLDVLVAAHAKGIVHRDIKPENLFVTREGRIRVLDFGVARLLEGSPTSTRTGAVFGTPAFMPPEQALGRSSEVDALSDIWAVGATALALLSGRYVHIGETVEEMQVHAATRKAPLLSSVAPDVPAAIAQVIDKALAFEKQDRWPSARAMQEALARARRVAEPRLQPLSADEWVHTERTKLAPRPAIRPRELVGTGAFEEPSEQATVPLPTLPAASTVAGVATHSETWRIRRGRRLLGVGAAGLLLLAVGVVVALATSSKRIASSASDARSANESATLAAPVAPEPTAPSAAGSVTEPPVVAIETLPTASPARQAASPPMTVAPAIPIAPPPRPTAIAPTSIRPATPPIPAQSPPTSPLRPKRDPLAP